ncbi:polysaccharide deacetylase family protein [Candidatus Pacearchaeota archaeon]|nr:polysaccharide deacetylase family protein [Candidatus Pacearchaeota archaeon]
MSTDSSTKIIFLGLVLTVFLISSALALPLSKGNVFINLNGKNGEVRVDDNVSSGNFPAMTWNFWVKQNKYADGAGLIGRYAPVPQGRSFLIRTSDTTGLTVVLSQDGTNQISYNSNIARNCGIQNNNEWTMITVAYNGSEVYYYRNGVYCDADQTPIHPIFESPVQPFRFGGANNVYFNGSIDDINYYSSLLTRYQAQRLYKESEHGANLGQSITVLLYHQVLDNANDAGIVTPANFKAQMDYLKQQGFTSITLDNYESWRKGQFTMPDKAVLIFFDDGRQSVLDTAYPIMKPLGLKGNLAIVSDYADGTRGSAATYMSWNEIKTLTNDGWGVAAHSTNHTNLLTLTEQGVRQQMTISKQKVKDNLGITATSFVFPFHATNQTLTNWCGEYFNLCWTEGVRDTRPEYIYKSTNGKLYQGLKRISIVNSTTMDTFKDILGRETNIESTWLMDEGQGKVTKDSQDNRDGWLTDGASWNTAVTPPINITNSTYPRLNWCNYTDINHDTQVTIADFILINNSFGRTGCVNPGWCGNADINRDGTVSIADFIDLSSALATTGCVPAVTPPSPPASGGTGGNNRSPPPASTPTISNDDWKNWEVNGERMHGRPFLSDAQKEQGITEEDVKKGTVNKPDKKGDTPKKDDALKLNPVSDGNKFRDVLRLDNQLRDVQKRDKKPEKLLKVKDHKD